MRRFRDFLHSTLVGGLLFLLPLAIIGYAVSRLVMGAVMAGRALHDAVLPESSGYLLPILAAFLMLVAIAFAAGALMRTAMGQALFYKAEQLVQTRVPFYAVLRHNVVSAAGGAEVLADSEQVEVALLHLDDMSVLALVFERRPDGKVVVFLPGAPQATSGSVAVVEAERLEKTDLSIADVTRSMRRLGRGLADMERRAAREIGGTRG